MKKTIIIISIIVLALLTMTCPNKQEHQEAIKNVVSNAIDSKMSESVDENSQGWVMIGSMFAHRWKYNPKQSPGLRSQGKINSARKETIFPNVKAESKATKSISTIGQTGNLAQSHRFDNGQSASLPAENGLTIRKQAKLVR